MGVSFCCYLRIFFLLGENDQVIYESFHACILVLKIRSPDVLTDKKCFLACLSHNPLISVTDDINFNAGGGRFLVTIINACIVS